MKIIKKRAQFYTVKAYFQQVDESHKKITVYTKLKRVRFLAIADFAMFLEKQERKSYYRLLDTKTYNNDSKDFYFIFMELEKCDTK